MKELLILISEYGRNCGTCGYMDGLEHDDPLWIEAKSVRLKSWAKIAQFIDELNRED